LIIYYLLLIIGCWLLIDVFGLWHQGREVFWGKAQRRDAEVAEVAEEDAEEVGKRIFTSKVDKFLRTRTKDVLDLPRRREGRRGTRSFLG
jgi:hypothetical protein